MKVKPWIRWLGWFVVAGVFAIACAGLASWQIERRAEAVSKIQRVAANYELEPISFEELNKLDDADIVEFEWRSAKLRGQYLLDEILLVRNRAIAGQPGFVQLVPFRLTSGETVIVERGWISADSDLNPAAQFMPKEAQKDLVARVQLSEEVPNRESPAGQITSINLGEIKDMIGNQLETGFYLQLVSESPTEVTYPQPLSRPVLDEGNHLSYAVQWVIFAVMGFFAVFWAIRQEREFRRMEADPNYVPRSSRKKSKTDDSVENEILDKSN